MSTSSGVKTKNYKNANSNGKGKSGKVVKKVKRVKTKKTAAKPYKEVRDDKKSFFKGFIISLIVCVLVCSVFLLGVFKYSNKMQSALNSVKAKFVSLTAFKINRNSKVEENKKSDNNKIKQNENKQQKVDMDFMTYLAVLKELQRSIAMDVKLREDTVNKFNNKLLTKTEYIDNMTVYKNRITSNVEKINSLNPPGDFVDYSKMIVKNYKLIIDIMNMELDQVKNGRNDLAPKISKSIEDYNNSVKVANEELKHILDKNGIKDQAAESAQN